jgi:glycosyltransferase involved in cell wall biosynthesis
LKVLQIIQKCQLRGAEIFACQLSRELLLKGESVDILYLFESPGVLQEVFPDLTFMALGASAKNRFWDFHAYRQLHKIIIEGGYSVVQANAGDTLKYAAISKYLYRWEAKLIFRNANKLSGFIKNKFHLLITRAFLRQCDFIISVSELCRLDLIACYPGLAGKSQTIPIGTYTFDEILPYRSNENEKPVIINISSFVPEKNHDLLIDIFEAFYKQHGKGFLWLVGEGKLLGAIKQKAKHKGLSDRIKFWGPRKDAVSLLKGADVMVLPSLVEGLPGVILEAFACHIPVVASDVGGISEIIEDGKTGFISKDFEISSFTDSLDKIVMNKDLRKYITFAAREVFERKFSMKYITSNFLDAYKSITTHDR